MLNWDLLQSMLISAIACSTITVSFIQKTKKFCRNSRCIIWYSLLVNMILGFLFSFTFTKISDLNCLWIGLFSFIGADTIYRKLEGKMTSYRDLNQKDVIVSHPEEDVIEEIKYD